MSARSGFSLVELVVVLVIVAILAALAIPRLTDSETRASWYVDQVRAGLRHAQRQAVAQRRNVYVEVLPGQLRLCYDAGCSTVLTQLADGQPYVLPAPSEVSLVTMPVFWFDALGRPQPGGQSIVVNGSAITVQAETGYVQ